MSARTTANPIVALIHDGLHRAADPDLAPGMAAYMKVEQNGSLPFLGVHRRLVGPRRRDRTPGRGPAGHPPGRRRPSPAGVVQGP